MTETEIKEKKKLLYNIFGVEFITKFIINSGNCEEFLFKSTALDILAYYHNDDIYDSYYNIYYDIHNKTFVHQKLNNSKHGYIQQINTVMDCIKFYPYSDLKNLNI